VIVDSSALVAILGNEPERYPFIQAIRRAQHPVASADTYLETSIVVDARDDPVLSLGLDSLLEELAIRLESLTPGQARIARQAYRDFGRGSGHPAKLNFGDCLSYALAKDRREPLLYKGDDFVHTDVVPAV
jgi:ribonuclease VapC